MSWNDPADLARAWHWKDARAPVDVLDVDDPDLPADLVACGRFVCLHVRRPGERGARVLGCRDPGSYVAFDPATPDGRLYVVLSDAGERAAAGWCDPSRLVDLGELAARVGGRQRGGYPHVDVSPFGEIMQVEYHTKKAGDGAERGATFYHAHARTPRPWLAVDQRGRLWYAGGDYVASDLRGIVG